MLAIVYENVFHKIRFLWEELFSILCQMRLNFFVVDKYICDRYSKGKSNLSRASELKILYYFVGGVILLLKRVIHFAAHPILYVTRRRVDFYSRLYESCKIFIGIFHCVTFYDEFPVI